MNLSTSFQISPHEPWVEKHNREVREVWESFKADRPTRVPVSFSGARTMYMEKNQIDYRNYYGDPDEMIRLQLEVQLYARSLPLGDTILGELPEDWSVNVDFHPVESASCFGCPVMFRPDAVPAHECAHLSLEQCRDMPMPDLLTSGLLPRQREFMNRFDQMCGNALSFLGKPVKRTKPSLPSTGGGTFSTALDIRGPDIMTDMYENPEFVHSFLERIAEWHIALHRAWCGIDGIPYGMDKPDGGDYSIFDHGIDMLSSEMYDEFVASLIIKICKKYGKRPSSILHHCGRGTHLFSLIKKKFDLTRIHALTWPLNDVAKVRREIGHDVWIDAVISDSILRTTPAAIRQAVKDFLSPEVKGKGRLSIWVPGEVFGIPHDNYLALYDSVKEHGRYG